MESGNLTKKLHHVDTTLYNRIHLGTNIVSINEIAMQCRWLGYALR